MFGWGALHIIPHAFALHEILFAIAKPLVCQYSSILLEGTFEEWRYRPFPVEGAGAVL